LRDGLSGDNRSCRLFGGCTSLAASVESMFYPSHSTVVGLEWSWKLATRERGQPYDDCCVVVVRWIKDVSREAMNGSCRIELREKLYEANLNPARESLCCFPRIASAQVQNTKVITGATLIDGTGGGPIQNAMIVIEGTRITQVGASGKTAIPKGASKRWMTARWFPRTSTRVLRARLARRSFRRSPVSSVKNRRALSPGICAPSTMQGSGRGRNRHERIWCAARPIEPDGIGVDGGGRPETRRTATHDTTINAAKMLDREKEQGTVQAGKWLIL
jgi:hypothetical protein